MKPVFPLEFKNRYIKCTVLDSCEVLSLVGEVHPYVMVMSFGFSESLEKLNMPKDVLDALRDSLRYDIIEGRK